MRAKLSHDTRTESDLVGELRRIGDIGPVYEVMDVDSDGVARIRFVESGRFDRYAVAEILRDPPP